jgi:hypothetical protein
MLLLVHTEECHQQQQQKELLQGSREPSSFAGHEHSRDQDVWPRDTSGELALLSKFIIWWEKRHPSGSGCLGKSGFKEPLILGTSNTSRFHERADEDLVILGGY